MVFNLNKKIVTKKNLLEHIQDIDVYRFYTGKEVEIKKVISSPLRDDENPSFGYFIGESNEICFKDFVLGGGDFVKFVELLFGLTFFEALSKIVIDFNLKYYFYYKESDKTIKKYDPNKFEDREKIISKSNNFVLKKKKKEFKLHDLVFWKQFGIDIDLLELYNVEAISHFFINGNIIKADKHAYSFIEYKDNKETYKIYQPYSEKYKWINGHNDSVWQGWEQLPEKGDVLIITKSLKDVMSISNILEIPSVSLQCENILPKKHVFEQLKERFNIIYLWYDNDFDKETNWGRKFSENISNEFDIPTLEIDSKYKTKDFSDLVKKYGEKKAKKIFNNDIILPF